jgi:ELWxxDGT repeat protein
MKREIMVLLLFIFFLFIQGSYAQPVFVTNIGANSVNFTKGSDVVFYTTGNTLWKTNGTPEGTVVVRSGIPSPRNLFYNKKSNLLFFQTLVVGDPFSRSIWRSDGTRDGTFRLAFSTADEILLIHKTIGDKVFFAMGAVGFGREPWVTNGTLRGTFMLRDIATGEESSMGDSEEERVALGVPFGDSFGTHFFFPAYHPDLGVELWKTDGKIGGTDLVKDIYPLWSGSYFRFIFLKVPLTAHVSMELSSIPCIHSI